MKKFCKSYFLLAAFISFICIAASVSSCGGNNPTYYPHYLTRFVEPNDFRLTAIDSNTKGIAIHPLLREEKFIEICKIEMQGRTEEYYSYDRRDSKVVHFLGSIGDTCYFKHKKNRWSPLK